MKACRVPCFLVLQVLGPATLSRAQPSESYVCEGGSEKCSGRSGKSEKKRDCNNLTQILRNHNPIHLFINYIIIYINIIV